MKFNPGGRIEQTKTEAGQNLGRVPSDRCAVGTNRTVVTVQEATPVRMPPTAGRSAASDGRDFLRATNGLPMECLTG